MDRIASWHWRAREHTPRFVTGEGFAHAARGGPSDDRVGPLPGRQAMIPAPGAGSFAAGDDGPPKHDRHTARAADARNETSLAA